jgi:hypothetical protein
MMSYPPLGEAKDQEDYRGFADGDYQPRHREIQHAERRSRAFALIASATAGRGTRDSAPATPTRGRHEGAPARRPRLWRRGSHGVDG